MFKHGFIYSWLMWFLMSCVNPAGSQEPPDLILHHGKIITVNEAFEIATAMAVRGHRILQVGDNAPVMALAADDTELIDLKGKTVMPGLIDSHTHPAAASVTEFDHPIPTMQSIDDVLAYIRERAKQLEDGEWIRVSQVFLTRLQEERYPTREELDHAAPNNPVIFRTGPDASVNSMALELSGIDEDWEVDDGGPGYAEKDPETGKLTGILRSCTRYLKYESPRRKPTREERLEQLKKLIADYNRVGLTGITERAGDPHEFELYQTLYRQNELTVRAYLSRHLDTIQPIEAIRQEIKQVVQSDLFEGNRFLRIGAIKVFMDGGMLTGSAYMREPWGVSEFYNITDPDYRGLRYIPHEKFVKIAQACMEQGIQLTAHCVGDGAVHGFIDGFAALQERFNIRRHRPVISHSNFMSREAVQQAAALGIGVDIQPAWLNLDGRTLTNQFGYERLTWFQPLRDLFAAGVIAGGGSDHMQKIGSKRAINFYDPWLGMWVAMTRQARWLDRPLHPEQALSRVEAIRFYTINNAFLLNDEERRGSLESGKLADFIIIDRDILTCPLDEVKNIQVLKTYVDGQCVYSNS